MLTARGWWMLVLITWLIGLGALVRLQLLLFLGLTLLFWFLLEWGLFTIRSLTACQKVTVTRGVEDERGPVKTLWAGRVFTVRVQLRSQSTIGQPLVEIADWLPFSAKLLSGHTHWTGQLKRGGAVELVYHIRCPNVGRVRFEGVRLCMADFQGFFQHIGFLREPKEYRVLPVLADESGRPASAKRFSLLPPPGIHRWHRPGSGSELLDLRDYLPGDPPRTIAWRVSARRARLITKEFESEVPIRCTLFVDTSQAVRLGPPGQNALAQLVQIAAAVAQANSSTRDMTGLCLFDDVGAQVIRPARTARHLAHLLNVLADTAGLAAATGHAPVEHLLPSAYAVAQGIYPDLLSKDVNAVPAWLPWLWPVSEQGSQPKTWLGLASNWLVIGVFFLLFTMLSISGYKMALDSVLELKANLPRQMAAIYDSQPIDPALAIADTLDEIAIRLAMPLLLGQVLFNFWLARRLAQAIPLIFSPRRRQLARWRKRVAALLSHRSGLAPGGLATFLEDDEKFSVHLQQFLAEHLIPYPLPLYDEHGRYLFSSSAKISILASALMQAVARGRDNELYVLLVDLLDLDEQLAPLLRAVRLARSHHHQVVVILNVEWGIDRDFPSPIDDFQLHDSPTQDRKSSGKEVEMLLTQILTARLSSAIRKVRRQFGRLGVSVVAAQRGEPVALVLERMDRLRAVRSRR